MEAAYSLSPFCKGSGCALTMAVKGRGMMVKALALLVLAALASAQITFSRDWTGGKRAAPLAVDCGQFARLCRHFLHDLKTSMNNGIPDSAPKRRQAHEDTPIIYEDE